MKEQDAIAIMNIVSMCLLILVLILWSGRPGLWTHSRLLTVVWSLVNVLGLAMTNGLILATQRYEMQCASSVESSVNAPWCTMEGFLYGFFGFAFSWQLFDVNIFLVRNRMKRRRYD
jgi:hypothetical protein